MSQSRRLGEFLDFLDASQTLDSLGDNMVTVVGQYRMPTVASGIIAGSKAATPARFHFARWPADFFARYIADDMQPSDPVPRWARGTGVPASYSDIKRSLKPKDPGLAMFALGKEFGFVEGICIPMRAVDSSIGIVTMTGDRGPFSGVEFRELVAIGSLVFRRAESIDQSGGRAQAAPILSLREIELLPFLVHGHSDREIADLSGISQATVRFHLKNARTKIGAVSRTHLAAKAVALGFVTL